MERVGELGIREFKSISDAWFQLVYDCLDDEKVYIQKIQKGSFENEQTRRQFPSVAFSIEYPRLDMVPVIPPALGIPSPTTMRYIEDYFANYLMNPELAENETYKYASRIHESIPVLVNPEPMEWAYTGESQLDRVMSMLKKTPLTNQAVLEIANPDDISRCIGNDGKLDPPCLRLIDFKIIPNDVTYGLDIGCKIKDAIYNEDDGIYHKTQLNLTMHIYFRSWDLWAGLPTNLGGLQLLKEYVADECGLIDGKMYCYSSGLHLYKYQEEIARIRTMKQLKK